MRNAKPLLAALRTIDRLPDHGQSLILFAAGLVAFLGLVGLSVDIGRIMYTRTELQRSADAAALAGSQLLPGSREAALSVADSYVSRNGGADCQPSCATVNDAGDIITVTTTRTIEHFFLKFVGVDETAVEATAAVQVTAVTGLTFGNPAVFPYTIWGGNPSYGSCKEPYGLCPGEEKIYRSNQWDNQVAQSQKGKNGSWSVPGNQFKGYFNVSQSGKIYQTDPNTQYSFGGNATGQQPLDELRDRYQRKQPIVIPVIVQGSCTDNCGTLHFTIVAWVALELINDPGSTNGDWKGRIVGSYQVPDGVGGGYIPPTASGPTVTSASLIE